MRPTLIIQFVALFDDGIWKWIVSDRPDAEPFTVVDLDDVVTEHSAAEAPGESE